MNYKKLAGSLFVAATLLVSCSKKVTTGVEDVMYTGPKMVNFNNYEGYVKQNVVLSNSFLPVEVTLKLANTTGVAGSPITVRLIKDDNAINEYNTLNGTSLTPIPPVAYRFDSTDVVIPRGARTATVRFEVNPTKLNLSNTYAFGVSIASVSGDGAVISSNATENSVVVELGALNQWDGVYQLKGYILRAGDAVKTGAVAPYEMPLITSTANSVEFENPQLWADGTGVAINYPVLTIATNNSVTITSNPPITPPVTTTPGYNSRYDPATKTFYISFYWNNSPTSRLCTDTLTYLRPR